jgi:hypothetical protein
VAGELQVWHWPNLDNDILVFPSQFPNLEGQAQIENSEDTNNCKLSLLMDKYSMTVPDSVIPALAMVLHPKYSTWAKEHPEYNLYDSLYQAQPTYSDQMEDCDDITNCLSDLTVDGFSSDKE